MQKSSSYLHQLTSMLGAVAFLFLFIGLPILLTLVSCAFAYVSIFGDGWMCVGARIGCLLYLIWFILDINSPFRGKNHGRWARHFFFLELCLKYIVKYFSYTIKFDGTAEEDLKKCKVPKMYCCHPHGVFGYATVIGFSGKSKILGRFVTVVTLNLQFYFPLWRDLIIGLGFCASEKRAIRSVLRAGREDIAVVVGGARETGKMKRNEINVVLSNRKGVFELALEEGAALVPVINFGENELYNQVQYPWLERLQLKLLKMLKIFPIVIYGRMLLFPEQVPMTTVIGSPIQVQKISGKPTYEQIDDLRNRYIQALRELHDRHRHLSPGRPSTLVIG